jgi:hypothetical protein
VEAPVLDFAALKRVIRQAIERIDPGAKRVSLFIFDADGQQTHIDIVCGGGANTAPPDIPLTEGEREVLQVFDETEPDEVLSRAEIAKRIGCDDDSHFRERLGRLVRLQKLVNKRPGYRRA